MRADGQPPSSNPTMANQIQNHHPYNQEITMNMQCDYTKIIGRQLKEQGYRDGGTIRGVPYPAYRRGPDQVVVVPPFTVPSRGLDRNLPFQGAVQQSFEKMLGRLIESLKDLMREGPGSVTVMFQGGGTLQLPEGFLEQLQVLGIKIVVIDPEEIEFWEPHHGSDHELWMADRRERG